MTPRLIGLTGRARAGKDTVASILCTHRGFAHRSFAAPMREFICGLLGVTLLDLERIKEQPHALLGGKTPRYALQTLGTEWGRNTISPSLWVDACIAEVERLHAGGLNAVISDVRFENEADAVRAAGGEVWHICRPGEKIAESAHASEAGIELGHGDVIVENSGTLADLQRVVLWRAT